MQIPGNKLLWYKFCTRHMCKRMKTYMRAVFIRINIYCKPLIFITSNTVRLTFTNVISYLAINFTRLRA